MEEQNTNVEEWSKSKKIVIFSMVGSVLLLSILAAFIPDAREYVTNVIKIILGSVAPISNL